MGDALKEGVTVKVFELVATPVLQAYVALLNPEPIAVNIVLSPSHTALLFAAVKVTVGNGFTVMVIG